MEGGGRLTVSVANEGMGCRISIADTGVGIPKDDMDKIFEPFYTTKEGGIGIGLAIVKDIIEENGGRISVESDLGRGTTFHIRLPGARGIG
jgi:signal transduction histidine kinase